MYDFYFQFHPASGRENYRHQSNQAHDLRRPSISPLLRGFDREEPLVAGVDFACFQFHPAGAETKSVFWSSILPPNIAFQSRPALSEDWQRSSSPQTHVACSYFNFTHRIRQEGYSIVTRKTRQQFPIATHAKRRDKHFQFYPVRHRDVLRTSQWSTL